MHAPLPSSPSPLLAGVLPPEIGNLTALTYLDLSRNQLTGAPGEIYDDAAAVQAFLSGLR